MMRDALRDVILNGTAKNLQNTSINLAGKTGTSEKYIEGLGRAKDGRYLSSFASIFPYEDPKFIMIVTIDEPNPNNYFGADVAALHVVDGLPRPGGKVGFPEIWRWLT